MVSCTHHIQKEVCEMGNMFSAATAYASSLLISAIILLLGITKEKKNSVDCHA